MTDQERFEQKDRPEKLTVNKHSTGKFSSCGPSPDIKAFEDCGADLHRKAVELSRQTLLSCRQREEEFIYSALTDFLKRPPASADFVKCRREYQQTNPLDYTLFYEDTIIGYMHIELSGHYKGSLYGSYDLIMNATFRAI